MVRKKEFLTQAFSIQRRARRAKSDEIRIRNEMERKAIRHNQRRIRIHMLSRHDKQGKRSKNSHTEEEVSIKKQPRQKEMETKPTNNVETERK